MRVNIPDMPEGHSSLDLSFELSVPESDVAEFIGDVHCCVHFDKTGARVQARIAYTSTARLQCARCLERYEVPVEGDFRLVSTSDESPDGDSEDIGDYIDENEETIDISSAVYDDAVTGLPMKPLCSDGCSGTPQAGIQDTQGAAAVDARWAPLEKLKKKLQ